MIVNTEQNVSLMEWNTCWLLRFMILALVPLLFSCSSPCQYPSEVNTYNCDKCRSTEFAACIKKNFPVGSSYIELSKYLTNIGFWKSNLPEDVNKKHFYFKWSANNGSGYEVMVAGNYDFNLKITKIIVDPDSSLDEFRKSVNEKRKQESAKK